jgi:hypothetical protein
VIDPDIFAVGDVNELLGRDMEGKTIWCRHSVGEDGRPAYISSSMLLDCGQLKHWNWEEQIEELFAHKRDYQEWVYLRTEPSENIGELEEEWNHFDTLNEKTKLLHNTKRTTQPWRTGLPWRNLHKKYQQKGLKSQLAKAAKAVFGDKMHSDRVHQQHPDQRQEQLFFGLLKECVDSGQITREYLQTEIEKQHLRPDALGLLESARVPTLS